MKQTKVMNEKIFIKTNRIGFIPQLGIQGPIVNPYPTTRKVAKDMIVSGIQVFQITDDKKVIELNLQNVFPGEGDPKPAPKKEKKNEKPVGKPVEPVQFKGIAADPVPEKEKEPKAEPAKVETPVAPVEEKKETEVKEENPKPQSQQQNNNQKNNWKSNKKKH